jgi:DUF1680 family protein
VVVDAVSDRYRPEISQHQKLTGLLATRMRVNLEGRLLHVDEKALLEGFQNPPGKQEWIGEHAGKFLDAAVKTYQYSQDRRLKQLMDRMAKELIAAQKPDGYLGTYSANQRWTSWDVWTHKYDLLGLLAYYGLTGDETAYMAAKKIGDLLVQTFGDSPGKRDILKSGEHMGMAATSVLEPMVYLYRYSGDPRYLEFCKYIVRAWDEPNGPKIIASLASTGSVFKTANAKAYEMMSNLVGLLELYRVTGDETYFKPAVIAWKDIHDKRLYLTGTSSSGEHFQGDHVLPADEEAKVGEGCATVTWMQLTLELLRLTGEAHYAEQLERTVYNQLLGAQDAKTGDICYFTPMNGKKNATPGVNCCVSSEPRGIALIPQAVWGRYGKGIAVVLYTGGHAEFVLKRRGTVHLYAETSYPEDGDVLLHVEPDHNLQFPLRLRVPEWTKSFAVDIGGTHLLGTPGQFLTLNREWKRGDTIKIKMDMTVHVVSGAPTYPGEVAIQRGPQVLAIEQSMNPKITDLLAVGPISTDADELKLENASDALPATWAGEQAYKLVGTYQGKRTDLWMVPFADAKTYRIWLKKPTGGATGATTVAER